MKALYAERGWTPAADALEAASTDIAALAEERDAFKKSFEASWNVAGEYRAAVERVRALHVETGTIVLKVPDAGFCAEDGFTWPCRTVRALDTPKEPTT